MSRNIVMVCHHDLGLVVLSILMPHGHFCFWTPGPVWLQVIADALILLAYFSIPIALVYFVRNRKDITFAWMFVCLGIFIFACGATYLMEIWNVRHSHYWLSSAIKTLAVLASVPTAILLARLVLAAQALRASEERFRSYFELGLIGMTITSPTKGWVEVNDEICRILGYERSELLRMTWAELTHPDDLTADVAHFNRVLAGETDGYAIDKRFIRKDGRVIDATISVKCLRQANGSVDYFVALLQDITERKIAERALRKGEERMRAVLESALDCIVTIDHQGRVVEFNPAAEKTFGYKRDAMIGQLMGDLIIPPTLRERYRCGLAHYLSTGEAAVLGQRIEVTGMRSDHSEFPVELATTRVGAQEPPMFTGFIRDITERKQAEQALRESEERFRELAENINEVFWVWTATPGNAQCLYVSPAYATIWGRSCESLYSSPQSWKEALHPQDKEWVLEEIANLDIEKVNDLTYRIVRPDQSTRWIRDRIFPVRDRHGGVVRFAGIAEDSTESKTIEKALESAEEQYRSIFNNAVDGIFRTSPDGKFLVANPAAAHIFGFASPEELIEERRDIAQQGYVDPRRREEFKRLLQEQGVVNGFEYEAYRKDGSRVWISENTHAVYSPSGEILYFEGIFEDITERKRAGEKLRQSHQHRQDILDSMFVFVGLFTIDGVLLEANRAPLEVAGLKREEVIGQQFSETYWWSYAPAVQERLRAALQSAAQGEVVRYDEIIRVANDQRITIDVTFGPLRDATGNIVKLVGSAVDISERDRARGALQQANEDLRVVSRRLFQVRDDERRHLARELHDEIGQALTAAKINLESIESVEGSNQSFRLKETVAILDNLLRQVRQISLDLHPSLLDDLGLAPALRSLLDQHAQRTGLRVQFSAAEPLENIDPEIQTTGFRIAQEAITNVLRHAKAQCVGLHLRIEAGQLQMKIVDDGNGFDLAEVERRAQQGADFGLIGMRERAALVGGRVQIISSPHKGTTIEAFLPLTLRPERHGRDTGK
jgi:PAS domain S-box-containing protein